MHVQVPEERQHEANKHELELQLRAGNQRLNEADEEQDRNREQQQTRKRRQENEQHRKLTCPR